MLRVNQLVGFGAGRRGAGNDANTLLLLHCDGTDASTTFTDSSASARTVTAVGNAQIDTAQSKFDGGSGLFDGTGDYLSVPDSADWLQASAHTWECWFRTSVVTGIRTIIGQAASDGNHQSIISLDGTEVRWDYYETGAYRWQLLGGTIAVNTWYHIAAVKNGSSQVLYLDGVSVDSAASTFTMLNIAAPLLIGYNNYAPVPRYWNGWIDEVRISNIARWTTGFTPPTVPYF